MVSKWNSIKLSKTRPSHCSINYSRQSKGKENVPLPFMKQILTPIPIPDKDSYFSDTEGRHLAPNSNKILIILKL